MKTLKLFFNFNIFFRNGNITLFGLQIITQEEKVVEKSNFSTSTLILLTCLLVVVYGLVYYSVFHSSSFDHFNTSELGSNILVSSETFSVWGFSSDSELLNAFNMSSQAEFLVKYKYLLENPDELSEINVTIEEFKHVVNNKLTPETIDWLLNIFNSLFT